MSKENPLISVAMPFYNCADTIASSIQGILRQTHKNVEIIAVDDGSQDDGAKRVETIPDPRIRLYRNPKNLGVAATRNRCLDLMRGEFMAPMDADDTSHPRRLEWCLAALEGNPALGVCGGWMRVHGKRMLPYVYRVPCRAPAVRAAYLFGNPYLNGTVLIRRDVLKKAGIRYDTTHLTGEDYELCAQVLSHADGINLPKVMLYYLQNPKGLTARVGSVIMGQRMKRFTPMLEAIMGRTMTSDELSFHAQIGNGAGAQTSADLRARKKWLTEIMERNMTAGMFESKGLAEVSAMIWFRICRNSAHLGVPAWSQWRSAAFSHQYRPGAGEYAGFLGSMLKARVKRGAARPQGELSQ